MKRVLSTDSIILLTILLIAAITRIGWPGLTEFKADEARLLALAFEMADFKRFAIRGISNSAGLPNFPTSVWAYAIPLFVWKSALSATMFTGLLNVLAVYGSWWLTQRYWGVRAAHIAALLFAVNPWAIHHSRKIWAQNLLAPFVVGWAICALLCYVDGRKRYLIGHLLCLALAIEVHLAAISLVPITLLWLVIYREKVGIRPLLWGAGLSAATVAPFAYYLLQNPPSGGDGLAAEFSLTTFRELWFLSTGRNIHALMGASFDEYRQLVPNLTAFEIVLGLLMLVGAWTIVQRRKRAEWMLIGWFLSATLFFIWEFAPVVLHYLIPAWPIPFMLVGIGVDRLAERGAQTARLAVGAVSVGAALQLWAFAVLLWLFATTHTAGALGTPLSYQLETVDAAKGLLAEHDGFEVVVASDGVSPRVHDLPAQYDVLLRGVPHRFVNANHTALFPAGNSVVIVLDAERYPTVDLLRPYSRSERTVALRPHEGHNIAFLIDQQPAADASPLTLQNAVTVHKVVLDAEAGAVRLQWQVGYGGSADYHLFTHVLDASGNRIAQQDLQAFPASQWRENDRVVTLFTLDGWDASAEANQLRYGMYQYPDLTPIPVIDVAGNPVADTVTLPIEP